MYNKSSGAIIYKLLVSSAVCVYSVQVPVAGTSSWYQLTGTSYWYQKPVSLTWP